VGSGVTHCVEFVVFMNFVRVCALRQRRSAFSPPAPPEIEANFECALF
jgi:hypothetical protein